MNVIVSGPFGLGILADEAVLGGVLHHLKAQKHEVTVFCANASNTEKQHSVAAVEMADPGKLLSTAPAWNALCQAKLMIVCSGGVVNAAGQPPARVWLSQFEHAQRIDVKTALVGAGALPISDARERIRVQRLLHTFTDSVSVRNDSSKLAMISYGLNANRVSTNGDPTLALAASSLSNLRAHELTIGVVLSERIPSRNGFGPNGKSSSNDVHFTDITLSCVSQLLCLKGLSRLLLFTDDTASTREFTSQLLSKINENDRERTTVVAAKEPLSKIQEKMAACHAMLSFNLHGLMLAAGVGVPVLGISAETGSAEFMASLGMNRFSMTVEQLSTAGCNAIRELLTEDETLRKLIKSKMEGLRRKELQNARMLELLVPKRLRYRPIRADVD